MTNEELIERIENFTSNKCKKLYQDAKRCFKEHGFENSNVFFDELLSDDEDIFYIGLIYGRYLAYKDIHDAIKMVKEVE